MNAADSQSLYKLAFASVRGMGHDIAHKFLDVIGNEKAFFTIDEAILRQIANSRSKIFSNAYRQELLDKARRELEFVTKKNIKLTYFTDPDFPIRLQQASDAPILLYSKGECDLNSKHMIAIVGTRNATPYGINFTKRFVEEIASSLDNVVIVSGLAYGIDIEAHRQCLQSGVPTVGVLAHGLNTIYPSHHREVAVKMVKGNSMILTDYTSQDEMHKGNFIARNRIVAALCDCTVVVESAPKGGALITASLAQGYNRDVFALPGRTSDEYSKGCNKLIKNNSAALITCADDLISAMRWEPKQAKQEFSQKEFFPELTPQEQSVIDLLSKESELHINTITNRLQIPVYKTMSLMVELESKGLIIALPGCRYNIAP